MINSLNRNITLESSYEADMKDIIEKIMADPRYRKNIEYGEPRSGHPEGKVKQHIADLEILIKMGRVSKEDEY